MRITHFILLAGASLALSACAAELDGSAPNDGFAQEVACGDDVCHVTEVGECESDCVVGAPICGNGRCGASESSQTCPEDCGAGDNDPPIDDPEPEPVPQSCDYPAGPAGVTFQQVHPSMTWPTAINEKGETVHFDMKEFYCDDAQWGQYNSVGFILGTGWCPACPDYLSHGASIAAEARDAGMLMVFVEAEDRNYVPSTSEDANAFLLQYVNDAPSLRIGDADTQPTTRGLYNSPVVTAFPSAWIVRRSDMMVVASQSHSQYILPFVQIANDPEGDIGVNPTPGNANCGEEDEEIYEPNNEPKDAPLIGPGSFEGGICGTGFDYFSVNLEGAWRFDLEFTNATGDLDVYIWDTVTNDFLVQDGRRVGSESISDNESFEHAGPATIVVLGFDLATAPYTATLTDLAE